MWHRIGWWLRRVRQKLWARPLLYALLAIADRLVAVADAVPDIDRETLEDLLTVIASSMLSVATLAVAQENVTNRPTRPQLPVLTAVSATMLKMKAPMNPDSAVWETSAAMTSEKARGGAVELADAQAATIDTVLIFAMVMMVFLRWVDRIARLGRLGNTIDRVEQAAVAAIDQRRQAPLLGGRTMSGPPIDGAAS